MAVLTDQRIQRAVELVNFVRRCACALMQTVDILRDNALDESLIQQFRNPEMGVIGFCLSPVIVKKFAYFCPAGGGFLEKTVQFDEGRIDFAPESVCTAERGNAAFHRDSRPGECHAAAR